MEDNQKTSRWDKFLDFMESAAPFFTFLAAVGGPIIVGIEQRKTLKCTTAAQIQLIQAQEASWLRCQAYLDNQRGYGTQN